MPRSHCRVSRRSVLGSATALGLFSIIPARLVRGFAANETVNVACIGVGNQGRENRNALRADGANIVGLCDVDENFLAQAAEDHPSAKTWTDYREMLEKQDGIDAVMVTTPDHVHAPASLLAMRLGKHVCTEKPLTHSVHEARALADAARKYNLATQLDNEGHASSRVRSAVEWVRSGAVGSVSEVHVWTDRPIWPQGIAQRPTSKRTPKQLNWDLWLGPAPARDFHEGLHPFVWRGWWDFGTGALGDIGCHAIDAPFWALNLAAPTNVQAEHEGNSRETFPNWSIVTYQFPERDGLDAVGATVKLPAMKLTWYDGGKKPPRPDELPAGEELGKGGVLFVGDKGKMLVSGRYPRLFPIERMESFKRPEPFLGRPSSHKRDWLDAIVQNKPFAPGSNFADFGGPLAEMVLLGNVAIRAGKSIGWDGKGFTTGSADTDALLRREYRKGWEVA